MINKRLIGLGILIALSGCKTNPIDRLTNPYPNGSVPLTGDAPFVIYKEEIKTGGGFGFIPEGSNQTLDLKNHNSPAEGANCIRYDWNGQDVPPGGHQFAGFSFSVTPSITDVDASNGKALAAYTKLIFSVKGTLTDNTFLRVEGPDDKVSSLVVPARWETNSLNDTWQEVTLQIAPTSMDFSRIKIFATVSIQYLQPVDTTNPGLGGTIYIDNIRYEK